MVGKRKNPSRRDWPTHLRMPRPGYYAWRHPVTGKVYGLGKDKREAFRQAIEANAALANELGNRGLVDRITGAEDTTVARWIARYEVKLAKRKRAKETQQITTRRLARIDARWGARKIEAITTKDVADYVREFEEAGKARTAQAMRSLLTDFFRAAMAEGWVKENPVEPTRAPTVEVTRARLTLEQFKAIYAVAKTDGPEWLPLAMELAIVTGQRREDLRLMGPLHVHDGYLWIEQGKTGNRVAVPLELSLVAAGLTLSEVIARCKAGHVLSRHFIHHYGRAGMAKPGDAVRNRTIAAEFANARDKAGVTWPAGKTPASFHEIRSLAARLYAAERGKDFAQALLGHKSADMAALYRDSRGAEWVKVPL